MNSITAWFLKQSPRKMFFIFLFGLPFYIWLFSIVYQLDNKLSQQSNTRKHWFVGFLAFYPIVYLLYVFITLSFFNSLMLFHLLAMLCGFILVFIAANSLVNFENKKGYSTDGKFETFWMLGFYLICVWSLQKRLNKYKND